MDGVADPGCVDAGPEADGVLATRAAAFRRVHAKAPAPKRIKATDSETATISPRELFFREVLRGLTMGRSGMLVRFCFCVP